ncbi:hypothetical protein NQK81_02320 [Amycolatopsis roodepoortensis]|uniref:hypothetical protein n=1 Tax=Amycolatopsis roodepoortensis TaxID=700274 RepID=UPI00214C20FE|nr:hypothetical protein [Amycolatopsis roodepoortensis]UUV32309.1 hypothetical protein NQK81_02320 [Amycolatopsis roodepoortensis]
MFLPVPRERVELVEVIGPDGTGNDQLVAIWDSEDAQTGLTLMAGLPDGELKRCFIPAWEIRAHSTTQFLFEISFCFRCHGARLAGPTVSPEHAMIHGFDAEHSTSRELLARLQAAGEASGRSD